MSKYDYRVYFAEVVKYVKIKSVLADMGMHPTNFYRFMKSDEYDWIMSIDMLETIKNKVQQTLSKLT